MGPSDIEAPSSREVNLEIQRDAAVEHARSQERDIKSLRDLVSAKNISIIRLETENGRLKMTRSDKELSTQVDGLRIEVGKKDRELVELRRRIETFVENEKIILRRAASAEAKIVTVQETLVRMQRARDAAQVETEKHDRERLEAVAQMISAADRAQKAEARLAELQKAPGGQPKVAMPAAGKK
jgi:chromosome segregation ATPase